MTTRDIFDMIVNEFVTTGECYGDICAFCKYRVRCCMLHIAAFDVLGGAYYG